jgi:prevent-host-death family protein
MKTITAFEAKTRFGELLDRVARGEEVVITRHDKPVARIVPEGTRNLEEIRRAVADLHALRTEMAQRKGFKPLTDKEIKDSINEGRH